jgi:flagellar basal-body rod modification protein FlgD
MHTLPLEGIGPDPSARPGRLSSSVLGRDAFLRLLVTQLRNQDPLKPLASTDFTAQLAQFSGLEQLFDMNDQLRTLLDTQAFSNHLNTVGFIGKEIVTPYTRGRVTGVGFQGDDPVLLIGEQRILLADVVRVQA